MDIAPPPNPIEHGPIPGHGQLPLPEFSASFPLPFRVLFLIGLGILLWAINVHILSLVGLNVGWILDFRDRAAVDGLGLGDIGAAAGSRRALAGEVYGEDSLGPDGPVGGAGRETYDLASPALSTANGTRRSSYMGISAGSEEEESAKRLYVPIYKLFLLYSTCVGSGWALFTYWTAGEPERMEHYRGAVGVLAVVLAVSAVWGLGPWSRMAERECAGLKRYVPSLQHSKLLRVFAARACQRLVICRKPAHTR